MRRAKIVCTIGPATANYGAIRGMAELGMDVARLNFSHGSHDEHLRTIKAVRRASSSLGKRIAILQDLPGPKIRIGMLADESVTIAAGSRLTIRAGMRESSIPSVIPVPYEGLPLCVGKGSRIFLADGSIRLRVVGKRGSAILCRAENGGELKSRKGVNVPDSTNGIPAITEEDERHMEFGARHGVDYVAVSFVRSAKDVALAKGKLAGLQSSARVIAKIEKKEGFINRADVIRAADAVMVARGDLGVEMGPYEVPPAQKTIIAEANRQGRPSITATQMLLSMVHSRTPTRAEVSDVANAILDGTSAVMLSEETASGQNYREAVSVLDAVARRMEADSLYRNRGKRAAWRLPTRPPRSGWATL